MPKQKPGGVMTPGQLWVALEARYPKREYAFLTEVRDATGFAGRGRTADAIALCLWPSRGLLLHGFEVKNYRGDWKREKDNPEKAEVIASFCDFWWLAVTASSIAPLEEVPATWGVLAPNEDASKLIVVREAERMQPRPWTRGFMASILRHASNGMVSAASVEARLEEATQAGIKIGAGRATDARELERLRAIEKDVEEFERASGLQLRSVMAYDGLCTKSIGEAIRIIVSGDKDLSWKLDSLKRLSDTADELAKVAREQVKKVKAAAELCFPKAEPKQESA